MPPKKRSEAEEASFEEEVEQRIQKRVREGIDEAVAKETVKRLKLLDFPKPSTENVLEESDMVAHMTLHHVVKHHGAQSSITSALYHAKPAKLATLFTRSNDINKSLRKCIISLLFSALHIKTATRWKRLTLFIYNLRNKYKDPKSFKK